MSTVKDFLNYSLDLVYKPDQWRQGVISTDNRRNPVKPASAHAKCFCTFGAMLAARYDMGVDNMVYRKAVALFCLANNLSGDSITAITRWNDDSKRSHNDIVRAFRSAIEKA